MGLFTSIKNFKNYVLKPPIGGLGVDFDPLLRDAGNNAFTISPSRWVELTDAIGIIT
jgi:hypothetical protein